MLAIGQQAPDFELPNQDGQPVRLSDFRGQRVVIFAFPKANTMGCTMQACAFRDEFRRIEAENAVVLGISVDSQDDLRSWKADKQLPYDLLSDPDKTMLDPWGAGDNSLLGVITFPGAKRSYWVIDEDGTIRDMQIGVRPEQSVRRALAALGAQ